MTVQASGRAADDSMPGKPELLEVGETSWEQVADGFLAWFENEAAAMKCTNPLCPDDDLQQVVSKHLAFNKISEGWMNLCVCGERRTESLNDCSVGRYLTYTHTYTGGMANHLVRNLSKQ